MSATHEVAASGLVGAVLSRRFRLTRLIGEGGMGAVYAADAVASLASESGRYPADAKRFAVKLLRPEFTADADVLARFLDEGKTCQRLIHPNILRVYEAAAAEDGTPYIVMELLEGVPLSAYTASGGRVPLQQAVTILQGILAGLAAAHAQEIVHRDLKPENVFLAREASGQFQIKLLDFGIAKVMDSAGGMGSRTKTGALLGTPAYMSPEQVKSAKDVDLRSDLWSAGVMTWEMLTGRVAFPAPTEYARLSAVLHTNPDPVEKIDPKLAPISAVIARAMSKDPAQRFPSALEMSRALTTAVASITPSSSDASSSSSSSSHTSSSGPHAHVTPLSRLPAVPSIFAPTSGISPGATSEAKTPAAEQLHVDAQGRAPGGTLASPLGSSVSVGRPATPAPTVVVVSLPHGATMPSHDLPILDAPGEEGGRTMVAAWIVVLLVAASLAVGVVIGYAIGRGG